MAYTDGDASATGMLTAGIGVLQRNGPVLGGYALANIVLQVIQKAENTSHLGGAGGAIVATIAVMIARIVVGAVVTRMILAQEGLMAPGTPLLVGTYVGVIFVFGLAVGFGAFLLIVPGILALTRWYLATTFVLARGMRLGDAFSASRDATNGHRMAIFGALFILGLFTAIPFGALILAAGGLAAYQTLPMLGVLDLFAVLITAVSGILSLAVMIGMYATLAGREGRFDEVFG